MAKLKQILIENLLITHDRELRKNLRKSVKNWIFGRYPKFYNIRELFKREIVITP
jgi:hypothetical protein